MATTNPRPEDSKREDPPPAGALSDQRPESPRYRAARRAAERAARDNPTAYLAYLKSELDAHWHEPLDHLVMLVDDAASNRFSEDEDEMFELLAEHFPGLAPAIRAVAHHLQARWMGERDRCSDSMAAVGLMRRWED